MKSARSVPSPPILKRSASTAWPFPSTRSVSPTRPISSGEWISSPRSENPQRSVDFPLPDIPHPGTVGEVPSVPSKAAITALRRPSDPAVDIENHATHYRTDDLQQDAGKEADERIESFKSDAEKDFQTKVNGRISLHIDISYAKPTASEFRTARYSSPISPPTVFSPYHDHFSPEGTTENSFHDLEKGSPFSSERSNSIIPILEKEKRRSLRQSIRNSISVIRHVQPLLPEKKARTFRNVRHIVFIVYRRLFSIVFLLNLAGLISLLARCSHWIDNPPLANFATAGAANIMVALVIRQDYVINAMFKLCWMIPHSAPLRLRRILAKVYEFGGIHSGAAVSSVIWFSFLTGFMTMEYARGKLNGPPVLIVMWIILMLITAITITSYPALRNIYHNHFELVHRWAGWFSLVLFWVELVLFSRSHAELTNTSTAHVFFAQPAVYFLLITCFHAIYPWVRLQKLYMRAEKLSSHAVRLHFQEPFPPYMTIKISHSPLKEWHSFAAIPTPDGGKSGGSIIVSNAGDWTRDTIDNPREYYWHKGVPVTGALYMAQIFKSVVIVTTGSGIGPCLSFMQTARNTKVRLIWSTREPVGVYGQGIVNMVKELDRDCLIWDTRKNGRPDLVRLAWDHFQETGAECVFALSNKSLTRKVVYGMEARGVPAFGPIWDS